MNWQQTHEEEGYMYTQQGREDWTQVQIIRVGQTIT